MKKLESVLRLPCRIQCNQIPLVPQSVIGTCDLCRMTFESLPFITADKSSFINLYLIGNNCSKERYQAHVLYRNLFFPNPRLSRWHSSIDFLWTENYPIKLHIKQPGTIHIRLYRLPRKNHIRHSLLKCKAFIYKINANLYESRQDNINMKKNELSKIRNYLPDEPMTLNGFDYFKQHAEQMYRGKKTKISWIEAEKICNKKHVHLWTIHSKKELMNVLQFIEANDNGLKGFYIGLIKEVTILNITFV